MVNVFIPFAIGNGDRIYADSAQTDRHKLIWMKHAYV